MKATFRLLLPVVVAAWLALPGVGSDGGDNAGGTGVWILPRANFLASDAPAIGSAVVERMPIPLSNASSTITLTAAAEMGAMTATMIDPVTGVAVAVPTNGHQIILKQSLLTAVRNAGVTASIVVVDSLQQGYVIRIGFEANGTGTIRVY